MNPTRAPLLPLLRTELRLHVRHRIAVGVAAMIAVWIAVVWFLPPGVRRDAVAWVLFLDVAVVGFYFAPALSVVERANGVTGALRLTRLSPRRALGVRMAGLAAWGLAAALAVTVGTGMGWAPGVLVGATLTALLMSLLAVVMVGRDDTLTGYLPRMTLVVAPLLAPALAHGIGLVEHPLLWLSPATGGLDLLFGRWSWGAAGWLVAACAALWLGAERVILDVRPRPPGRTGAHRSARRPPAAHERHGRLGAVRSFASADRRSLLSDGMLVMLALGIPLLASFVRLATGPGLVWLEGRFGVDLAPHLPAFWALVLVFHAPVMVGAIAGMLFLEDRDAGLLPAIATTPAGLRTLVGYRLSAAAGLTAAALAVALPLAGATHAAGMPGVLATALTSAAVSTVPAVLLASLVGDRVAGMALMKAIGLPLYLPLAWWFVDHPAGWLFALVPTGWAAQVLWAETLGGATLLALGGALCSAVWVAATLPRLRRSVVH